MPSKTSYEFLTDFKCNFANMFGLISLDSHSVFYVEHNGLAGAIDITGKEVIPPETYYGIAYWKSQNVYRGKRHVTDEFGSEEEWYELFDDEMNVITKERYTILNFGYFQDLAEVRLGDKYGFIYSNGEYAIPLIFDDVRPDINKPNADRCVVGIKNRYGLINAEGKIIIPIQYDNVYSIGKSFVAVNGQDKLLLDHDGNIILEEDNSKFKSKKRGEISSYPLLYKIESDGKFGVIDDKDQVVIPAKYDYIGKYYHDENLVAVTLNNLTGFFDKTGNKVIDFNFSNSSRSYFLDGVAVVSINDNQVLINKQGIVLTNKHYDEIKMHSRGELDLLKVEKNGAFGLINRLGQEVVAPKYDQLELAHNGYWLAKVAIQDPEKGFKWGVIDHQGNQIIPYQYNYIDHDLTGGVIKVVFNNLFGLIDTIGNTVLPAIYNQIIRMQTDRDVFIVKKGSNYAFIKINR